ncbi:MAG: glycosyltransferase family 2 protein [Oscillospiraceae bacterium]|nr:glycosyltransferase family 2 protein [Oscillospiraceae bacterium]
MGFLKLLADILSWCSKTISRLYFYLPIYTVIGFFATRRFSPTDKRYKYAILVAARNEESVIGNLLDSIKRQDYTGEVTVFVAADNCTDNTAKIARDHGAVCYERFDPDHRTKGYALQFLVECIRRDFGIHSFDGYFIFDADNLLKQDYISRMNEAFATGEKIITSYRNTKNFGDNWISASYGLHWLRTVRTEHRARSLLHLATRIQGTGFLFASEIIENGWNYTSLTEDRAFCADAVVNGYRISYNDAAEFYDEQPTSLKIAARQRIRWAKGHLQALFESGGKLFLNIFKPPFGLQNFISFDILSVVIPSAVFTIFEKLISLLSLFASQTVTADLFAAASSALAAFLVFWVTKTLTAAYIFIVERRRIANVKWYKKLWFCCTFWLFDAIGAISLIIALFTKVEWKPIPHEVSVSIDEVR